MPIEILLTGLWEIIILLHYIPETINSINQMKMEEQSRYRMSKRDSHICSSFWSFFFYFYILEELYLMVHTFIIQILGFQELFNQAIFGGDPIFLGCLSY